MNKKKIKLIIIFLLMCLYFPTFILAETIILKSGQTVEGKVIEKTEKYIKIDFESVPLTYFWDEVESIDGVKVERHSGDSASSATGQENQCIVYDKNNSDDFEDGEQLIVCKDSRIYTHALYKFTIKLPVDWGAVYINERNLNDFGKITSIAFGPQLQKDDPFAMLHIMIKKSSETSLDEKLESMERDKTLTLESGPIKTKIHNFDSLKTTYSANYSSKLIRYIILKDGFLYTLSFNYQPIGDYQRYLSDFDKIIESIIIGTKVEFHNLS